MFSCTISDPWSFFEAIISILSNIGQHGIKDVRLSGMAINVIKRHTVESERFVEMQEISAAKATLCRDTSVAVYKFRCGSKYHPSPRVQGIIHRAWSHHLMKWPNSWYKASTVPCRIQPVLTSTSLTGTYVAVAESVHKHK